MADVAFLLLIFFLVTTTIQTDTGLNVVLPVWSENNNPIIWEDQNVLSILINADNELMVEGNKEELSNLKSRTEQLVLKEAESPRKAIVSLQNHTGTSYNKYLLVYNEIKAAYHKIWDDAAVRKFGQHYDDLMAQLQGEIRRDYPLVISETEPSTVAMRQ